MAPNLAASQHQLIGDMILSRSLKQTEMAGCSERAIRRIASNLRLFGKTKAPWNGAGRRRIITPQMLDTLCEHLLEKPGLYRDKMAVFLYDEFGILVTVSSMIEAGLFPDDLVLEETVNMIVPRANGMFIWLRLLVEYLKLPSLTLQDRLDVIHNLNRLGGLDSLNRAIIDSLEFQFTGKSCVNVRRLFHCVAYANDL